MRAARERASMVQEVLDARGFGITDGAVLEALMGVPRHRFTAPGARPESYANRPVSIGRGQVTSKPYLVAVATQMLALTGRERVLEIGTGTGYHAAILARLALSVVSLELDAKLAAQARSLLAELAPGRVEVICKDGRAGHAARAPYDGISVAGGMVELPRVLLEQLTIGGRLVAPVGPPGDQWLTLVRRTREGFETRRILDHEVRYFMLRAPQEPAPR